MDALRPEPLETASLSEALADVAGRCSALYGMEVRVTTTGTERPLLPEAEAALLRTAREALANVAKHAQATRVGVTLSYMEHKVALDVRDDGRGFDPALLGDRTAGNGAEAAAPAAGEPEQPTAQPGRTGAPGAGTAATELAPARPVAMQPRGDTVFPGTLLAGGGPRIPGGPDSPKDGGFGLVAMRQRIEGLAGTLQIESEPGAGTGICHRGGPAVNRPGAARQAGGRSTDHGGSANAAQGSAPIRLLVVDDHPEEETDTSGDPDAADEDIDGLLLDDGPDPRAGRLVADDEGVHEDDEADLIAHDAGIDGGAATAEEAALHVVEDDDNDIRSGD